MTDSAINDLDPRLQPIANQWLDQCAAAGLKVRITVTWRSATDQNDAKIKGLSKASAGNSPHNVCLPDGAPASRAWDFASYEKDGTYITNGTDPSYAYAGSIAMNLGLVWGGIWTVDRDGCGPDFDHCEMTLWRTA